MQKKRVSQTNVQVKHDMYEALLRLLQIKSLSTISVSDLTSEAHVSRMSFYRNYQSMEDILKEHLEEAVCEYMREDANIAGADIYFDYSYMTHCFSFLQKKHELIDALISCGMGDLFLAGITDYLVDKWNIAEREDRDLYVMSAFAGSIYNMYREWSKRGLSDTPEELAEILSKFPQL